MRYERRCHKDGTNVYYSFVSYDSKTGKQTRLTREQIRVRFGRDIVTEEDAKRCLKLLEAQYESEKMRVEKRLAWQKEFYNFDKLLEQYVAKQRKRAPNSWKNNEFYLKHYVLYWFLQVKRLNNIEIWSDYFEEFREWLETAKTIRNEKKVISYSSKNHAIKGLNTFLDHLHREKLIAAAPKCEAYGEHLINKRTIDDVIQPGEMEQVYQALLDLNYKNEAYFFRYLYFSGMRFNEGLAISLGDLFQGEVENEFLRKKMKAYELRYHGYIVSEGQFGGVKNGHVLREPFKGQKSIEEKYNRVIPVLDKKLWNVLVDLAEKKHSAAEGKNSRDLLLFEGIDATTATNRLQAAFEKAKLKYRSWHCCRHSRATLLIGETGDATLARIFLGHTSPRTIEKYNHIWQQITRAAKAVKTSNQFALKKV